MIVTKLIRFVVFKTKKIVIFFFYCSIMEFEKDNLYSLPPTHAIMIFFIIERCLFGPEACQLNFWEGDNDKIKFCFKDKNCNIILVVVVMEFERTTYTLRFLHMTLASVGYI